MQEKNIHVRFLHNLTNEEEAALLMQPSRNPWEIISATNAEPAKPNDQCDRLETTAIYLNFTDAHVIEEFSNKWCGRRQWC